MPTLCSVRLGKGRRGGRRHPVPACAVCGGGKFFSAMWAGDACWISAGGWFGAGCCLRFCWPLVARRATYFSCLHKKS